MKKPNIVLICSDQHRYDCIGVNSKKGVKTPNLDKIAIEGINFKHAFTPCPVCTPSRVSMLTSQWSFNHGLVTIPEWTELKLPDWTSHNISFTQKLKETGYALAHIGKWHSCSTAFKNENPSPFDVGFDEFVPESNYYQFCIENGIESVHLDPTSSQKPIDRWGDRIDINVDFSQSRLHWGADLVIDTINRWKDDRFFIRWDPTEPHLPNYIPADYADKYPLDSIELWPSTSEDLNSRPYALSKYMQSWGINELDDLKIKQMISSYYANIELLDVQIGRILKAIEASGNENNTLFIFTTDHGDTCGSHRLIDKHFNLFDDIVRVPFLLHWPDKLGKNIIRKDFVSSSIDLPCTILDAAGIDIPQTFKGKSLLHDTGREDIFSAYHGAHIGLYSMRMVRNTKFKYIFRATDQDEFYDLESDPWEMDNLISQPGQKESINYMRKRLVSWMEETGDPLITSPWIRQQLLSD